MTTTLSENAFNAGSSKSFSSLKKIIIINYTWKDIIVI